MTPEALPDPIAVAAAVAAALESIGVAYVIGGSVASSLYGEPRSTNDVDLVADLDAMKVDSLIGSLGPGYYVSNDAAGAAARRKTGGSFNIIDTRSAVKVDVFVAGSDAFDRERLRRRQAIDLSPSGPRLFVDTPENVVLRKLEWFRRGGEVSERQWRDVIGVLRAQNGRLDSEYLENWASRLHVTPLLHQAAAEAKD